MSNHKAQEYYEQEFLKELESALPDEELCKSVESAYQRNHEDLERQEIELWNRFKQVPYMLKKVSELSGIDPATLVKIVRWNEASYRDLSFVQLLGVIRDFYVVKDHFEKEQAKQDGQ